MSSDTKSVMYRRQHLLELAAHHTENLNKTQEQLDLGVPHLVVNTDKGYTPSLEEVNEFVLSNYHGI